MGPAAGRAQPWLRASRLALVTLRAKMSGLINVTDGILALLCSPGRLAISVQGPTRRGDDGRCAVGPPGLRRDLHSLRRRSAAVSAANLRRLLAGRDRPSHRHDDSRLQTLLGAALPSARAALTPSPSAAARRPRARRRHDTEDPARRGSSRAQRPGPRSGSPAIGQSGQRALAIASADLRSRRLPLLRPPFLTRDAAWARA